MKLDKMNGMFGDIVYRVAAKDADGRIWYCIYHDRADAPDRKGVVNALWQARRALRAELLNRGFWQPGDEGMAA